jgi:hypothetical protein
MPDKFLARRDDETFVRVDLTLLAVALEHPDVGTGACLVEDFYGYLASDRGVVDLDHHVGGDFG